MSFPFEAEEVNEIEYTKVPREYEIDYKTGQLTGRIVEGLEAIKVWIYLALNTSRYRHIIYTWDYGVELEDLIGQNHSSEYLETEVSRMISECLLINENIIDISDLEVSAYDDKLSISFIVNTMYGKAQINV